jgi:hypothetical protein
MGTDMHKSALLVPAVVVVLGLSGSSCSAPAEAPSSLPPAGLAGAPASTAPTAPTAGAVDPNGPLPPGHPPIDNPHGGAQVAGIDDGAPLPPRVGQAPLPNFAGLGGSEAASIGGIGGNVVFAGKVLEKLDVPQYTYLRLQTTTGEEWVAVSTMQVNVGDRVTINQQLVMENFASKSLGRTFPRLVMGSATVGG